MRIQRALTLIGTLLILSSALARERILVPVAYTGPGAYGSFWVTQVQALNRTPGPWRSPGIAFHVTCPIPEGCLVEELPSGVLGFLVTPQSGGYLAAPGGLLLTVPSHPKRAIAVSARVSDTTRFPWGGTELPTPHEREFRAEPLLFPSVRLSHVPYRSLLRLYALDHHQPLIVRLRLLQRWYEPLDPIAEHIVAIPMVDAPDLRPGYVQIDLNQVFGTYGGSDVEVVPEIPAGSAAKVWGFVSVTQLSTNEITIISPM